jgi:hypothetical protein
MIRDIVSFVLVGVVLIVILVGSIQSIHAVSTYYACEQLKQLQPELHPVWGFFNGCMIVNPYTGYLQNLPDWSDSQKYLRLEK